MNNTLNIEDLPLHAQQQLLDYAEFLSKKYSKDSDKVNNIKLEERKEFFEQLNLLAEKNSKRSIDNPYKTDNISFENINYLLNEKIECSVIYEEGSYILKFDELDILVWGESKEEAEEAFAFAFHSLYSNYATENNENLTEKAIELKKILNLLVKEVTITDEAEKN